MGTTLNYGFQKNEIILKILLDCNEKRLVIANCNQNQEEVYQNLPNLPIFPTIQNKGNGQILVRYNLMTDDINSCWFLQYPTLITYTLFICIIILSFSIHIAKMTHRFVFPKKIIGPYEYFEDKVIGRGTSSITYEGNRIESGQRVCIKKIDLINSTL